MSFFFFFKFSYFYDGYLQHKYWIVALFKASIMIFLPAD